MFSGLINKASILISISDFRFGARYQAFDVIGVADENENRHDEGSDGNLGGMNTE